jgi:hypothetical protein
MWWAPDPVLEASVPGLCYRGLPDARERPQQALYPRYASRMRRDTFPRFFGAVAFKSLRRSPGRFPKVCRRPDRRRAWWTGGSPKGTRYSPVFCPANGTSSRHQPTPDSAVVPHEVERMRAPNPRPNYANQHGHDSAPRPWATKPPASDDLASARGCQRSATITLRPSGPARTSRPCDALRTR